MSPFDRNFQKSKKRTFRKMRCRRRGTSLFLSETCIYIPQIHIRLRSTVQESIAHKWLAMAVYGEGAKASV